MMSPAEERFRVSSDESDNMNTETYVKLNYFYLNWTMGGGRFVDWLMGRWKQIKELKSRLMLQSLTPKTTFISIQNFNLY